MLFAADDFDSALDRKSAPPQFVNTRVILQGNFGEFVRRYFAAVRVNQLAQEGCALSFSVALFFVRLEHEADRVQPLAL